MKLRALIFDLDGTLANTLPVAVGAFQAAFALHLGREYSGAEIHAMFGPNEEGIVRKHAPPESFDAVFATYVAEYERRHDECASAFDGLSALLDDLRGRAVRVGLVTGKGPTTTPITLAKLGLDRAFDAVQTGAESGGVKPAAIAHLLERWRIQPADAAYCGDHPHDVRSAREAGVVALAAAWAPTTDHARLMAERPDQLFRSVAELHGWVRTVWPDAGSGR